MANHLFKITAIKNNGKLLKGMSVEIIRKDTTSKPTQHEIAEAISKKYNIEINHSSCGHINFEFSV